MFGSNIDSEEKEVSYFSNEGENRESPEFGTSQNSPKNKKIPFMKQHKRSSTLSQNFFDNKFKIKVVSIKHCYILE